MSIEAFLNMQNARVKLTKILSDLKLQDGDIEVIMTAADFFATTTGALRVNEALEKLTKEIGDLGKLVGGVGMKP